MARCVVCGKHARVGRQVSHSGQRTRRLFKPNLHTVWLKRGDKRVRLRLCTKCLRKIIKEQKEKPASPSQGGPVPNESPAPKSA